MQAAGFGRVGRCVTALLAIAGGSALVPGAASAGNGNPGYTVVIARPDGTYTGRTATNSVSVFLRPAGVQWCRDLNL